VEERERIERERLRAQEEKAKRLESEIKGFEEQRKDYQVCSGQACRQALTDGGPTQKRGRNQRKT